MKGKGMILSKNKVPVFIESWYGIDVIHGIARILYHNGGYYKGEVLEGKKHGKGTIYRVDIH